VGKLEKLVDHEAFCNKVYDEIDHVVD